MRQRAGDPVEQAVVARHGGDVEREDPARAQALARELEELARREVEGHVGLVVGVGDDQVVALVGAAQERPRVGVVHGQARVVLHAEVAPADAAHGRIELDAVDPRARVVDAERPRDRPAGVAEDGDALRAAGRAAAARARNASQTPPVSTVVLAPDRVHGDALVQAEQPAAVVALDDLDELVERLLLVQQPVLRLDRARRDRDERRERRRDHERLAAEQQRRREREHDGRAEQRALRADERDQDERRQERAEQRAGRRERVEAAGDGARGRDVVDREPDRERRDHPEQHDRGREEQQHREERADDGAGRGVVEVARPSRRGTAARRTGSSPPTRAAASTIRPSSRGSGRRSASLPPSQ